MADNKLGMLPGGQFGRSIPELEGKKESHILLLKTPDLYSGDGTACIPVFSIYTEILS